MQLSQIPNKIAVAFATGGGKNAIPTASQIGTKAGAASYTDGFPPLTRTPLAAGGVPPSGADMNGVLFDMSSIDRWLSAGSPFLYDTTFATAIGGYVKGANVITADGKRWVSRIENNLTDPSTPNSNWIGANGNQQGFTPYTTSQTILPSQSGTLIGYASTSAAGTFTLPAPTSAPGELKYDFTNYSGFTLTVATPSGFFSRGGGGSSIIVPSGTGVSVIADGVNWQVAGGDAALAYSPNFTLMKASNGYQKLPSGLIIQWGLINQQDTGSPSIYTWPLPIAFPNAALHGSISVGNQITGGAVYGSTESITQTGISGFTVGPTLTRAYRLFALGY